MPYDKCGYCEASIHVFDMVVHNPPIGKAEHYCKKCFPVFAGDRVKTIRAKERVSAAEAEECQQLEEVARNWRGISNEPVIGGCVEASLGFDSSGKAISGISKLIMSGRAIPLLEEFAKEKYKQLPSEAQEEVDELTIRCLEKMFEVGDE